MSFLLAGYSEYGCQDFILPEIDNANHTITLDHDLFCIPEDIDLFFDVVDGVWRFLGASDNSDLGDKSVRPNQKIQHGDSITVTMGSMNIAIVIMEFSPEICGLQKYRLGSTCHISVGCEGDNQVVCMSNPLVSRHHMTLSFDTDCCTVTDQSTNGTFVNGRRVRGSKRIEYGACISFFGIQIIWLGNIIAIGCKRGDVKCGLEKIVSPLFEEKPVLYISKKPEKYYFRRSPRSLPTLLGERIEVEAPPQPQKASKRPLFLTIGPSLTMAVPMIAGTAIAIFASRSSGTSANMYMYTGIIIAILSAVIGAMWAVINMRYAKKQEVEGELYRIEKYKEYIARVEKEIAEKYAYNEQSLNYIYPDAMTCTKYDENSSELWSRNVSHEDFLFLRLGVGAITFQCPIIVPQNKFSLVEDDLAAEPQRLREKYSYLKGAPIGIDLREKKLVGVVGQRRERAAILKNVVVQAAANICYTDLKLVFLFDGHTPSEYFAWAFARWLPHTWSTDHKIRYFASNGAERSEVCFSLANTLRSRSEQTSDDSKRSRQPYYIVFVSDPKLLEGEPVSKYLIASDEDLGVTTVFFAERYEQLPNNCVDIIQNDEHFMGILNTERGDAARHQVTFDSIDPELVDNFAHTLSSIEVLETESGGEIPDSLTFLDMYHVSALKDLNVADRWLKSRTYENLRVPIGQKAGGATWNLDIHEKYHGPHGLIAGTTGSGKSETLQTYILSLAVNFSPNDVAFFLIDFKGGGMANLFANLPHTAGYISNLSGNQVHRAMVSIKSENRRRQRFFSEFGVNHIDQYTRLLKNGEASVPMPHLFIIIDEFAELKREEPDFMRELISVAQVGRSLGVHLILATQKPSGTVDDNIWSNARFRLCLRVQDRQDSNDVLHKPDAAYLTQAGRCYMQVGNDEIYELFQSGWSGAAYDGEQMTDRLEIASIWSNTGKSTITGTNRKLRRLEQKHMLWLTALFRLARTVASEIKLHLPEAISDDSFWPLLYQALERNGFDYPMNPANTAKALDFLKACAHMCAEHTTDDSVAASAMAELQQNNKQLPDTREKTQLAAIVEYLANIAKVNLSEERFRLWLPILPQELYLFDVCNGEMFDGEKWPGASLNGTLSIPVGIYDDPANQAQDPLVIDFAENGNLAICGSVVSGKSTFLQTLLFGIVNRYSPNQVNIYVLDYSNHLLAPFKTVCHCGGVVFDNEPDQVEKLFVLLSSIVAERKRLFQGGSYTQFVKMNGAVVPYIILAIDNYASFREKTDNKYESDLLTLSREGANYGIYLLLTAGGFGATELQNRIADNFRSAVCLDLGDKFKYSEVLRTHRFEVLPESNIKGRGLANVNGRILEYQTALAVEASDDYDRAERLTTCFNEMNLAWHGKNARRIPTIPNNPVWSDFLNYEDVDKLDLQASDRLPFGWIAKDASIAAVELFQTYCWLICGRARTGKTNLLKVLASSASLSNSERFVFDFSNKLRKFADENGAGYVSDSKSLFEMMKGLIPKFKERNVKKQELIAAGYDEEDIYKEMKKYVPIFLFIDDLSDFLQATYHPTDGVGQAFGFLENITEKGYLHNIYIIAALDLSKTAQASTYKAFNYMTSYKTGIHLGGNVTAQRFLDFSGLTYQEQSKLTKPGTGLLPSAGYGTLPQEVVIPQMKR